MAAIGPGAQRQGKREEIGGEAAGAAARQEPAIAEDEDVIDRGGGPGGRCELEIKRRGRRLIR